MDFPAGQSLFDRCKSLHVDRVVPQEQLTSEFKELRSRISAPNQSRQVLEFLQAELRLDLLDRSRQGRVRADLDEGIDVRECRVLGDCLESLVELTSPGKRHATQHL